MALTPFSATWRNDVAQFLNAGVYSSITVTGTLDAQGLLKGKGTATNDDAAAGYIGEFVHSEVAAGAGPSLSTGTAANVTSISLTAGDWDVWGLSGFTVTTTTNTTQLIGAIGLVSATIPGTINSSTPRTQFTKAAGTTAAGQYIWAVPTGRLSLSSTTTVYLVALAGFTAGTVAAYGYLAARRMR